MTYNTFQNISGTAGGDCLFNKPLLSCYRFTKGFFKTAWQTFSVYLYLAANLKEECFISTQRQDI